MAENTFRDTAIGMVLICLFAYLLIVFALNGGTEYNLDTSDLEGNQLDVAGLNTTLDTIQGESEEWKNSSTQQTNIDLAGGVKIKGMYDTAKSIWEVLTTPFSLISQIMTNVFHIPRIVLTITSFIFTIVLVFALWKLIKQGQ